MSYKKVELGDAGQGFRLCGMVVDIDMPIGFGFFVVVAKLKLITEFDSEMTFYATLRKKTGKKYGL